MDQKTKDILNKMANVLAKQQEQIKKLAQEANVNSETLTKASGLMYIQLSNVAELYVVGAKFIGEGGGKVFDLKVIVDKSKPSKVTDQFILVKAREVCENIITPKFGFKVNNIDLVPKS